MALKSARIVDFCGKSSVFADFENTVDRGSAVIFDADSGLCVIGKLMSSSKLFLFPEVVHLNLGYDTVIGIVLCCCHQACCLLF